MYKMCSKLMPLTGVAVLLALASCGGQPIESEEAPATDAAVKTGPVPEKTASMESAAKLKSAESGVEVSPRIEAAEPKIEMQPIPAKVEAPVQQAATAVPENKVPENNQKVIQPLVKQEPQAAAPAEPTLVSKPKGPNHFLVTVGPKQSSHPSANKGHPMGFLVDGVSGKQLVVERGKTYSFEIASDAKHDVYLSTKEIGWGGTPLSAGVEGAYTYKGTMTFKPSDSTPSDVYYACRNHPYMGARIHVVNPGEKITVSQPGPSKAVSGGEVAARASEVTEAKVKQKLMFAQMMINSQGAKRVAASTNAEAKNMLSEARQILADGRQKSLAGALPEALSQANRALKMVDEATRLVPSEEILAEQVDSYKSLLAEVADYQKSHKTNLKHQEKKGAVSDDVKYDEKAVAKLISDAKAFAGKNDYVRANGLLQKAQKILTVALHKMLDSKTLVYDLNFETAADEYDYELKRFGGYEELIPVAIEAKKPAPGAIKLMESFLAKARTRRDEAEAKAASSDYGAAIGMMQQATMTVRRALRMVGVTQ